MMKIILTLTVLITSLTVQAADYSEKTQYLGVVNGQVVNNSVIKVTRTPAEPILFHMVDSDLLPGELVIRRAFSRPASGGMANITVKQTLSDGQDAKITLKACLIVDGHKAVIAASQRGEDVVINVPTSTTLVELRSDAPVELEVPANYRGDLQITVEVEGIKTS